MTKFEQYLQTTTQTELAGRIAEIDGRPITQGAISQWLKKGIPPKRVLTVSRITGIDPKELRPDVFGSAA